MRQSGRALDPPSGLDESAGLAGWLYTDLLLGLLVVFLGGVAFFVPQITQDDGEAATTSTSAPASTSTTSVEQSGTLIPTTVPVPMCVALGGEDQITRVTLSRSWSDEQLVAEAEAQIQFGFAERGISRCVRRLRDCLRGSRNQARRGQSEGPHCSAPTSHARSTGPDALPSIR